MVHQILILLFITGIKAIFSAADTSFTYLNKAEISQLSKRDKKARKIKILMDDSNKFFGIIEVGINMSELIASAYASMTIVNSLAFLIAKLPISLNIAMFMAALIMTVLLAYVLLVFGSVLPKKYARNNPKKTAYQLANLLWIIAKLNHPFERLIDISNRFFSKIFHLPDEPQEKLTEKQIKMIITEGREQGIIESIEKKILFNALQANDTLVKEIMVPLDKVDTINIEDSFEKVLRNIDKFRFTRIPVYQDIPEHIIGILNIKDFALEYAKNQIIDTDIKKILRKAKFVNGEERILAAFKYMQKDSYVLAIVTDNEKQAIGIITIEDIVEKLVGKIFDEYDKRENHH